MNDVIFDDGSLLLSCGKYCGKRILTAGRQLGSYPVRERVLCESNFDRTAKSPK
jgi:hypothetical protein